MEIAEQYVKDAVEGRQPVSDVLPFNPREERILKYSTTSYDQVAFKQLLHNYKWALCVYDENWP